MREDQLSYQYRKCKNCGHLLWVLSGMFDGGVAGDVEHWTRWYEKHGYPYSTKRCYAPNCQCVMPEKVFTTQ